MFESLIFVAGILAFAGFLTLFLLGVAILIVIIYFGVKNRGRS